MDKGMAVALLFFAFGFFAILCLAVGWLWSMFEAFRTHPGWGCAVLLAWPWGSFAFAFANWQRAKWPTLLTIAGFVGILLMGLSIPILEAAGLGKDRPHPTPSPTESPA